jgi:hypothetical protein
MPLTRLQRPPNEPQQVEVVIANQIPTIFFPVMYRDISSKNTLTALTDMLVSKIHQKQCAPGSGKKVVEHRALLIRFRTNIVSKNEDWILWFDGPAPDTDSDEYLPWNTKQKKRASALRDLLIGFHTTVKEHEYEERRLAFEADPGKPKPRYNKVADTLSTTEKAIRGQYFDLWMSYVPTVVAEEEDDEEDDAMVH